MSKSQSLRSLITSSKMSMLTSLLAVLSLSGCSSYSENGLVGDYVAASKCPANGCANQAPDANYISLKAATTSIIVQSYESRAEIAGDCYPSTYPTNQIMVTTLQNSVTPVDSIVFNTSRDQAAPYCKNGRFNFMLNTANFAPGFTYSVKLELVGIDANGGRHTNAAGGRANISIRK